MALHPSTFEYLKPTDAQLEAMAKIRGEKSDIAFGSQIRTYFLQPYTLVKDHRTDHETGNTGAVLDGDIDPFIEAYLKRRTQTHDAS